MVLAEVAEEVGRSYIMRKIIGAYIAILGVSGMGIMLGFVWILLNISDFKVANESIFSYIFIINLYFFGVLGILGLIGFIVYLVDRVFKYFSKQ